ncbi:unnamed protein product [Cochlearia groenlandica]
MLGVITVSDTISEQPLYRLLVSSIITGYTLWNVGYRVSIFDVPIDPQHLQEEFIYHERDSEMVTELSSPEMEEIVSQLVQHVLRRGSSKRRLV